VLCDTAGHAIPAGVRALLRWTRRFWTSKGKRQGARVAIEWHGHDDRGLALTNALAAVESGADRIHACGLGIGERVGQHAHRGFCSSTRRGSAGSTAI